MNAIPKNKIYHTAASYFGKAAEICTTIFLDQPNSGMSPKSRLKNQAKESNYLL